MVMVITGKSIDNSTKQKINAMSKIHSNDFWPWHIPPQKKFSISCSWLIGTSLNVTEIDQGHYEKFYY